MPDYMHGEICIGGSLPRSILPELTIAGLSIGDCDGRAFGEVSEEAILESLDNDGILVLCDYNAGNGCFEDLENLLRENNVPFRRQSAGKYDILPEIVEFRPDVKAVDVYGEHWEDLGITEPLDLITITMDDGSPLVGKRDLMTAINRMKSLRKEQQSLHVLSLTKAGELLLSWSDFLDMLLAEIPPDLPPLPRLTIVDKPTF